MSITISEQNPEFKNSRSHNIQDIVSYGKDENSQVSSSFINPERN